jgi:hypothetical protein
MPPSAGNEKLFATALAILAACNVDKVAELMSALDAHIGLELKLWGMTQPEVATYLAAQEARGAGQTGTHLFGRVLIAKGQEIDLGGTTVGRKPYRGDSHTTNARILDLATNQLRQSAQHLLLDTLRA